MGSEWRMRTRILALFPNVDVRSRLLKALAASDLGQSLLRPFPPLVPLSEVTEGVSRADQLVLAKELRRELQREGVPLTLERPEIRMLNLGWGTIPWVVSPLRSPLAALGALSNYTRGTKKAGLEGRYALLCPLGRESRRAPSLGESESLALGPHADLFPLRISAAYLANMALHGAQEEGGGTSLFWEIGAPAWLPSIRQLSGGADRKPRPD